MKTKKIDEFLKLAQKRPRTKFAVVGKGTTWTFHEGADLAKATAGKGDTMIRATCQRSTAALKLLVVGGTPEITLFKTRVFAAPLKANPKAMTFKPVKAEENAELELLQAELDGSLVEQVGGLPGEAREALLPLLNEAKALAEDGDVAGAKAKVQELRRRLAASAPPPDEAAQRKALTAELQGHLVEEVAKLKSPHRDPLLRLFNEALKLASGGDLKLAKAKVAELKSGLSAVPPPRPIASTPEKPSGVTFKQRLAVMTPQYQEVLKKAPLNKAQLELLMKGVIDSAKTAKFDAGLIELGKLEAELKVALEFFQLKGEKDAMKQIRLCEAFLGAHADHGRECAAVEDVYAEAKKAWGVAEAKKAYEAQMKDDASSPYNPGNKFGPKHREAGEKGSILDPAKVKEFAKKYKLEEAEVIAIRTYTAADYKYINPAVANQKDHPERQKLGADGKPIAWMDAQHRPDPSKAKNATEKKQLEKALAEYEAGKKTSLMEEGALHAGMVMEAFKKLPKKAGTLYRGARMNMQRFDAEYSVGKQIPVEAFMSQSVSQDVARGFADGGGNVKLADDATVSVFVEVDVHDARDISEMSIYGATEAEWLLPPGGKLVVDTIAEDSVKNAGHPAATAWKKVRMRQVPA
jgi:ADP-ribosyltransferase exoenzyme